MRSLRMRCLTSSVALSLIALAGTVLTLRAQERLPEIRRIYVPADAPESWPAGDWTPIPAAQLERAERGPADDTPSNSWIKHARYSATFRDGTLQDGAFGIEIESPAHSARARTSLLSWENTNIAFSNLRWEDRPAQLGTSLENKTLLLVPAGQRRLSGEWSLRGRPLASGFQFRLQLPPAAVTEMTLTLPTSAVFKAFDQTQWEWLDSPSSESRSVRLNLGSRTSVDFAILRFDESEPTVTVPSVFAHAETLVVLSRDQSRIRQELLIEALEAPLSSATFEIPGSIEIREVELGGRPLENWSITGDRKQFLNVSFPVPITGLSRPLRLTGLLKHPLNDAWELPRIVPLDSVTLSERVTINVAPPWQLLTVTERGYRQTAASTTADGSGSLIFEAIAPQGSINLSIGLPLVRWRTEIVTRISRENRRRSAFCELTGTVSSGRLYDFTMDLAESWHPTSIALYLDDEDDWFSGLHWWISEEDDRRLLNVELPRAISRDQSLRLRMNFQQSPSASEAPVIPVVRTQNDVPCDQLLVMKHDLMASDRRLTSLAGWSEIELEDAPEWLQRTRTGEALTLDSRQWSLFSSRSPAFVQLPESSRTIQFAARPEDRLVLRDDASGKLNLSEVLSFEIANLSAPLSTLRFSASSDASLNLWTWSVADRPGIEVQCLRRTDRADEVGERSGWELAFVPPLTESAHVTAQQTISIRDGHSAVLPVVQNSHQLKGRVIVENQLSAESRSALSMTSRSLEQPAPRSLPREQRFESAYTLADASLRCQLRDDRSNARGLKTNIRWETLFPSADSDLLLHDMTFELPPETTRLTGFWPAAIDPPAAWVNGVPVLVEPDESGNFEIDWEASPTPAVVELEFLSQIEWNHSEYRWSIPVPQFDLDISQCSWTVQFPEDCRISDYSEPVSLIQSCVSSPIHWSRRFFGPLGRRTDREFFQPLNATEWKSLFEPEAAAAERSTDGEAAACRFRLLSWPREVRLNGWSETRQERYAWACYLAALIFGVLIRIARWESRARLAAWSLSLLGLIAWTAPESLSIFTGAIFAAAVTAALIPRKLLLGRRGVSQELSPESELTLIEGSTVKNLMARVLLIGAVLAAAGRISAQSASRTVTRTAESRAVTTVDVLVPFSGAEPPAQLPNFVYIRESDRQLPIFRESPAKPPVLFTSADYHCRLSENETPTIRVRLQAELPVDREIALLTIPLAGANLAREGACFVDGEAAPVAITPEGLLEISLPARSSDAREISDPSDPLPAPRPQSADGLKSPKFQTVDIELNLYPPVSVQGTVQAWELQIPSISNSRFRCEYPQTGWPAPRLEGSQGEVNRVRDGLIAADLGKSTRISCQWSITRFPETGDREPAQIEVRPIASIELLPTHLRYRIQTKNRVREGNADFLSWHVPVNFHLHKVISDDVVLQTREVFESRGGKRITFDLAETLTPQSGTKIIEVEFIVPFLKQHDQEIATDDEIAVEIPNIIAAESDSSADYKISGSGMIVGLWWPPELPLDVLELPDTGIRTLTEDDWKSLWPEDASLPVPERVYELETPAELSFLRTATQPQKETWVQETGTIGDQYFEWEWNAEVKTTGLPAFQHEFQIDPGFQRDPRLEILSVSVREEDKAQRVHRWSRDPDTSRLIVRLSRKTEENSQNVTIRGRILLEAEQELELPEIRLLTAERRESRVELYISPHRTARWLSEDIEPATAVPAATALNRGELTLFDNFSRRDDDLQHRKLIVGLKVPPPHFERLTTLRRRSDGDFDVSVLLTEQSSSMRDEVLQVIVPEAWGERLRPLPSMRDAVPDLEPRAEGGVLITIPPENRSLPLLLQTTLSAPEDSSWTVPWPGLKGEATYHNIVSLRLSDGWAPHVDYRIDPADDSLRSDNPSDADRWEYLGDATLRLQRTELSDPEAVPTVMQLLTTVELQPGELPHGQWWILYRGRGQKSIALESPVALQQVTAQINAQEVEADYDEESRYLTVPLLPGEAWQSCLVNWTSETPLPESVISETQLPVPAVIDLSVRESRVILVADSGLKLTLHHDLKPESAVEFRLKLLEFFQRLLESRELLPQDFPNGLSLLLSGLLTPAGDSGGPANGESSETVNSVQQNRLAEVSNSLRERLPAEFFDLPAEGLTSSAELRELTRWESLLPGMLAGSERPDREVIYFSIPENPQDSKVWWVSRQWYRAGIAILVALVLIPLSLKIIRVRSANWAAQHRPAMWLLIGLIWWTCLQLSAAGLIIAAAAVLALLWNAVAPRRAST